MNKGKLDIFAVLSYLDENNLEVYETLREDPEMLNELEYNVTWMLPQWMTGASSDGPHAELLENFNGICNDGWFKLYGHPELQTKLLACCGTGKTVRHKYYKPPKALNRRLMLELLGHKYPDIREEEVEMWIKQSSKAAVVRIAEAFGYQKKEVTEVTKAFDALRKG